MASSPMEQGELQSSPDVEIEFGTEDSHLSEEEEPNPSPERVDDEDALDIKPPQAKLPKKKDKHRHKHDKKRSAEKERKRDKHAERERLKHRDRERIPKEHRIPERERVKEKEPREKVKVERDVRDSRPLQSEIREPIHDAREKIREQRELREQREMRDQRDVRDTREIRDGREIRDIRDGREIRDAREIRDTRDIRDTREIRDTRDIREIRDPREVHDTREVRDRREVVREPKDRREVQVQQDSRAKEELRDRREYVTDSRSREADVYIVDSKDAYKAREMRDGREISKEEREKDRKIKIKREREEEAKRREKSRKERERLERLEMERRRLERERQRHEHEIREKHAKAEREREREKRKAEEKRRAREELNRRRERMEKRSHSPVPVRGHMTREEVKRRKHSPHELDYDDVRLEDEEDDERRMHHKDGPQSPDDTVTESSDNSESDSGSESSSGSEKGREEELEHHQPMTEMTGEMIDEVIPSPEPSDTDDEPVDTDDDHHHHQQQQQQQQPMMPPAEEEEEEEEEEEVNLLPSYYPAIEGCRNVDEFLCLNRIEEGTYGVVYRAKDKKTHEVVALKRLKMEKEKEGFPITSLREVNTLLKSQHVNIVTVREIVVGSNMDKIYIVMDYVEHDLKSLMETMKVPFMIGEVKTLMMQLLRGVIHLHDNWIIHRDLKTSNLLLSHKGILKIGDFGLAREYGSPLKQYTPVVVTLWYRAPELLLGTKEYTCPIDLWSVGCIFAEFLTKSPLFPGKSEIDQLNRIFKELGTPNEKIWTGVSELPAMKKVAFTDYPFNKLRNRFGTLITERGFDLMNRFLTYNPSRRITGEEGLKHDYFVEAPLPIDPSMFPTWPAKSEQSRKHGNTPKPPSGGMAYNKLCGDDDILGGFHLTTATRGGTGFSLKF